MQREARSPQFIVAWPSDRNEPGSPGNTDLIEAQDIKMRQEYTDLYKKDLHNPDNHDGVITHLEPDILF